MKHWLVITIMAGVLGLRASLPALGAESAEEQHLISVLQSNATLQEKDAACSRLKRIGTAASVPALAALLTDEQLSHSARYALESMSAPEAGAALCAALKQAGGLVKLGIIDSLGKRGETRAVPELAKLLADANADIAAGAAVALGQIGGTEALSALQAALPAAAEPARGAIVDGLLRYANRLLTAGDRARAAPIFQQLCDPKEKAPVRTAAFRGMLLAAGDRALAMAASAIEGNDGPAQVAALQMARELPGPQATATLAALLPKVTPAVQLALIEALGQRGDPQAAPAILPLAKSAETAVRLAAITALGVLGDASAAPALLEACAAADAAQQKAARQALLVLHRGNVTEALLAQIASTKGAMRAEVIRALGGRADASVVPRLLELAASGDAATQMACFRALAMLAEAPQVAVLTRLLLEAKSEAARGEAQAALAAVCQRAQGRPSRLDPAPLAKAVVDGSASAEGRAALLQVCSGLVDAQVRAAMRAAAQDADSRVRLAAFRAQCESRDAAFLPDLLTGAREATELAHRVLAFRGYVRLATEEETAKQAGQSAVELLKPILAVASRAEEKRIVLSGLANLADPEALKLVAAMLDEAAVQAEAAQAATQIAGAIAGAHHELAESVLKKVLAVTTDASRRQAAEAVLKQLAAMSDFITAWRVAGPYREAGKDYAALFDVAFPPELPAAKEVAWRLMPTGADPNRPWLLDLLKALGGEQCVAYARTAVYAPKEQPALLELGVDDGVKVWLNGKLVHANNVARPLTVGSDKVNVTLQPGWNTLLFKITQNNMAWEYCARLARPDGARLEGLQIDPARAQ
jgi:HEAT repeat protein